MHFSGLLAAVAVLVLGVDAAPTTCPFAMSKTGPGQAKCDGTLASPKSSGIGAGALITAVVAEDLIACVTACKNIGLDCKGLGYAEQSGSCSLYKKDYNALMQNLQVDPTSDVAYYSSTCFIKKCTRATSFSNSTTSSFSDSTTSSDAPCTATEIALATETEFTQTTYPTVTAVAFTTLEVPTTISTATNYIVENVTAFDIVTVIHSVFNTITLPTTAVITSTSTLVETVNVTSTISTLIQATSSVYYPLAANNAHSLTAAVQAACVSPVATVTSTATQTNQMASINATTTTVTITSTPEAVTETFTTNVTVNVPVETQTAYFNTSVIVTRTLVETTTLYAIPVTTSVETSSQTSTVSSTTTTYVAAPTPTCPTSDGKIWSTNTTEPGYGDVASSWSIRCDTTFDYFDTMAGGVVEPDFYSCIQSCAEQRAGVIAESSSGTRKRGFTEMYCQATQFNGTSGQCDWAYYASGNVTDKSTYLIDVAVLTQEADDVPAE